MPIYEYKCGTCGQVFEVKQKFSDAPITTHEGCGGSVERLISAPAIQFKGSGWYVTDYAKSGGQKASNGGDASSTPKADKPATSDSSSSSTSSSTSTSTETKK